MNRHELVRNPTLESAESLVSPPANVNRLSHRGRTTFVVREDLLPGGTKQRAVLPFLERMQQAGYVKFVYASPFAGFAQVALAYAASLLQAPCTVFAERTPGQRQKHAFTSLAESYGAKIVLVKSLQEAEILSEAYASRSSSSYKIPLGFDCEVYRGLMFSQLERQWQLVCAQLPQLPKTLWISVGSGVLTQIFVRLLPESVRLHGLDVHVLTTDDPRIAAIRQNPRITLFSASAPFAEAARVLPKIPSNLHYDAKLWEVIGQHGQEGDVWWNVAR